jgi:hypothetical protein
MAHFVERKAMSGGREAAKIGYLPVYNIMRGIRF